MNYGDGGLSASDVALLQGRNGNGFGDGNNAWWIILFLIFGWGRGGYGFGGGNGGGTSVYEGYVLSNDFSNIERKIDGVYSGICDSTFALNNTITNGFASAQNTMTQGFAGLNTGMVQQGYENRIAVGNVANQLNQCCCDLKGLVKDNRYDTMQNINMLNTSINNGFVSLQQANCLNTRDIIENQNANYRALHDEIVANRIEDKNAQITAQQNEIAALRLAASQERQNNYLVEKLQYPKCPIPAYTVPNPYCNCNNGCGCNC